MSEVQSPQEGIAQAVSQLSEDTRLLVRQEIDAMRDELWQRVKGGAGTGTVMMAGAGLLGAFSVASAYRSCMRILEKILPPSLAAMFATAAFGGSAGYLAFRGYEHLKAAPPVPAKTARRAAGDLGDTASRAVEAA